MTPRKINALNEQSREKWKHSESKVIKYCSYCKRNREVTPDLIYCPICNNHLRKTLIVEREKRRIARENRRSKDNKSTIFNIKEPEKSQYIPKCPTCQSPNIRVISSLSRAIHGYAFGIFSKTARSQFECKDCGYKW